MLLLKSVMFIEAYMGSIFNYSIHYGNSLAHLPGITNSRFKNRNNMGTNFNGCTYESQCLEALSAETISFFSFVNHLANHN